MTEENPDQPTKNDDPFDEWDDDLDDWDEKADPLDWDDDDELDEWLKLERPDRDVKGEDGVDDEDWDELDKLLEQIPAFTGKSCSLDMLRRIESELSDLGDFDDFDDEDWDGEDFDEEWLRDFDEELEPVENQGGWSTWDDWGFFATLVLLASMLLCGLIPYLAHFRSHDVTVFERMAKICLVALCATPCCCIGALLSVDQRITVLRVVKWSVVAAVIIFIPLAVLAFSPAYNYALQRPAVFNLLYGLSFLSFFLFVLANVLSYVALLYLHHKTHFTMFTLAQSFLLCASVYSYYKMIDASLGI